MPVLSRESYEQLEDEDLEDSGSDDGKGPRSSSWPRQTSAASNRSNPATRKNGAAGR